MKIGRHPEAAARVHLCIRFMLSCAVRRLSAQEWRDATVPVHEPVLVTAPLTIQPDAALNILANLSVGVMSSSSVNDEL